MATGNLDYADLQAAGNIHEDMMNEIFDISPIDQEFTDRIGSDTCTNQEKSWTTHALRAVNVDNARVDGADVDQDDSSTGTRVKNQSQLMDTEVQISTGSQAVDSVADLGSLAEQIMYRQQELRRDSEGQFLTEQASQIDDGATVPGISGAYFAFVATNTDFGATGSDGGYNSGTGLVDAPTAGTTRALTETQVRDVQQQAYKSGGKPSVMMMIPDLKSRWSEYLFTSSARVGTLQTQTDAEGATAVGSVDFYVTDFGTLEIVPNRIMQPEDDTPASERTNVGLIDPSMWAAGYLQGYNVKPLGSTGHSDKRLMSVYRTLMALNEASSGAIRDIDYTLPVTQA